MVAEGLGKCHCPEEVAIPPGVICQFNSINIHRGPAMMSTWLLPVGFHSFMPGTVLGVIYTLA